MAAAKHADLFIFCALLNASLIIVVQALAFCKWHKGGLGKVAAPALAPVAHGAMAKNSRQMVSGP
jgi:hypothetical protein